MTTIENKIENENEKLIFANKMKIKNQAMANIY
jgi:hypothetical protein